VIQAKSWDDPNVAQPRETIEQLLEGRIFEGGMV
jgi:hypothetical protein